uniref:Uncharacterized protein n=1 Tax=Physcomitrium patens TaxID=3218 RepID=A0A2K1JHU7_PHYPA|nr:hypothetical protein PHYPA_018527 [Physcomitrium patens]
MRCRAGLSLTALKNSCDILSPRAFHQTLDLIRLPSNFHSSILEIASRHFSACSCLTRTSGRSCNSCCTVVNSARAIVLEWRLSFAILVQNVF